MNKFDKFITKKLDQFEQFMSTRTGFIIFIIFLILAGADF